MEAGALPRAMDAADVSQYITLDDQHSCDDSVRNCPVSCSAKGFRMLTFMEDGSAHAFRRTRPNSSPSRPFGVICHAKCRSVARAARSPHRLAKRLAAGGSAYESAKRGRSSECHHGKGSLRWAGIASATLYFVARPTMATASHPDSRTAVTALHVKSMHGASRVVPMNRSEPANHTKTIDREQSWRRVCCKRAFIFNETAWIGRSFLFDMLACR